MTVAQTITEKLTEGFAPSKLEVIDESHKHAGHVGARPEGETHFHVVLQSAKFSGQNRVSRQRMVYKALSDELAGPVHALSMELSAPEDNE